MRVCVIGNSHIVSLQSGWKKLGREFAGIEPIFFAAPVRLMEYLGLRDGKLVADNEMLADRFTASSGGRTGIDGSYDAYILYGLALSTGMLLDFCDAYRSVDFRADGRRLLSRRCHLEGVCALLQATLAGRVLGKLRKVTRAPVFLLAAPMRSEAEPKHFAPLIENGDDGPLNDCFLAGCRELAGRDGARFVSQPPSTLGASPLTTQHRFSLSAGTGSTLEGDYMHMDGKYGALLLRHLLPLLTTGG